MNTSTLNNTHLLHRPSVLEFVIFVGLYGTIAAAALVGNSLVIFVFCIDKTLGNPSGICVLNIAVADFMIGK